MGGEGILGLEAACASLTEPGDRVLVIDNEFWQGLLQISSRSTVVNRCFIRRMQKNPVDPAGLEAYLEKDSDFRYTTLVHCDTPKRRHQRHSSLPIFWTSLAS